MIFGVPFDYEPLRENRFFVEFPSELGIEVFKIRSFKKPSLKINSVSIPYLNANYFVSGQYTWEEIDITFIDTIGPSTSQQIMEWIRLSTESLTSRQGYFSAMAKDLILKSLDPTGVPTQMWRIEKAIITSADFGKNDHTSDAIAEITVTIQPQRCILLY